MRTYKRKTNRGTVRKEDINDVVAAHVHGDLSLRKAAREFGVNYKTLSRYVKIYKAKGDLNEVTVGWKGPRAILSPEQEVALSDYIKKAAAIYHGINIFDLRKLAYNMLQQEKLPESWKNNEIAGKDWCYSFLNRHPEISLRTP